MPIYEYRCSQCGASFELRRPGEDAGATPPPCPNGHEATRKVISVFATVGRGGGDTAPMPGAAAGGGCGPGCACAANA